MSVKTAERLLLVKAPSRGPPLKQSNRGGHLLFSTRLIAGGPPCSAPPWQLFTDGLVFSPDGDLVFSVESGVFAQVLLE